LLAIAQSLVAVGYAIWVCGLTITGNAWLLILVAVANGFLGTTFGLFASAFAATEFQVVQFMPALVFPQILLGGIFIPRSQMPDILHSISDWLPLTHSIEALQKVATQSNATGDVLREIGVVALWAVGLVVVGSITLRRQTN
jgi:ABC-2 type transport system permease protein